MNLYSASSSLPLAAPAAVVVAAADDDTDCPF